MKANKHADLRGHFSDELGFSYEKKCNMAKTARKGDVWVNIKTGRKVVITGNGWRGVMLHHETGKKTQKQHHYFAYDYNPGK